MVEAGRVCSVGVAGAIGAAGATEGAGDGMCCTGLVIGM